MDVNTEQVVAYMCPFTFMGDPVVVREGLNACADAVSQLLRRTFRFISIFYDPAETNKGAGADALAVNKTSATVQITWFAHQLKPSEWYGNVPQKVSFKWIQLAKSMTSIFTISLSTVSQDIDRISIFDLISSA